jgi:hypothetical protein
MKFMIAVAMLIQVSAFGTAEAAKPDDGVACNIKGEIYQSAASSRDQGMPPETAYGIASGYLKSGYTSINKQFLKDAINQVYFDQRFANARGAIFRRQMTDFCLNNGKPKYQPLR